MGFYVGFHSSYFPVGLFSLTLALNIWFIQPTYALEDEEGELYNVSDGHTVTPMRVQTLFPGIVSSKSAASQPSASQRWNVYSAAGANPSSVPVGGVSASQGYGAAAGSGSASSNPQNTSLKYQAPDGSKQPLVPPLDLSRFRGHSRAGSLGQHRFKKKKSAIQQAREWAAAAAGAPSSRHGHPHPAALLSLSSAASSGAAAPQHSDVQSSTRVSLSSVGSLGSPPSGRWSAHSVTHKGSLSSSGSSESPSTESSPSLSSDSPPVARLGVSSPPFSGASVSQREAAAGAGAAASPYSQSQAFPQGVVVFSANGMKRPMDVLSHLKTMDSVLFRLKGSLHTDSPQSSSSKQEKPPAEQAAGSAVAANAKLTLVPQKAVIIGVQTSSKPKAKPAPQKAVKAAKRSFLDVPGRNACMQASTPPLPQGVTEKPIVVCLPNPPPEKKIIFQKIDNEGFFQQVDNEGFKMRAILTGINGFQSPLLFLRPRIPQLRALQSDYHVFHVDIRELVISYLYGDRLGIDIVVHGEKRRDLFLDRLVTQRYPKAIRFQLFRRKPIELDASEILKQIEGIFNPKKDITLKVASKICPHFSEDLEQLSKVWLYFRPGRLFQTMGKIFYNGVVESIQGKYYQKVASMSFFALHFCLLAKRYEGENAYSSAVAIYNKFLSYYEKRIVEFPDVKNPQMEALLKEMRKFLLDRRFWEGNENGQLDFNLETAK